MIEYHYVQARKKFIESGDKCDEHIWSQYIGRESIKYVAVCLRCSKVCDIDEWEKEITAIASKMGGNWLQDRLK